tara:strand:+ start:30620 stop:30820 length:201 start_codon:yes stop_codon:yes gene_type:complete
MIPVEGHKHLYRDEKSGAIINCDTSGYMAYKKMKNRKTIEKSELDSLKSEVDTLKRLLSDLIEKNS